MVHIYSQFRSSLHLHTDLTHSSLLYHGINRLLRLPLGTEKGEVIDIDPLQHGRFMATMVVREDTSVIHASYFGPVKEVNIATPEGNRTLSTQSLSLYLANGEIAIFRNVSSACCMCVHTRIVNGRAKWNEEQTVLAVVGYYGRSSGQCMTPSFLAARFIDGDGNILLTVDQVIAGQPGTDVRNTFTYMIIIIIMNIQLILLHKCTCGNE